jgi:3-oxoacyl-[acyl-carrier-protein] synthase III
MNRFNEIKAIVDQLEGDMDKFFDKSNKTAGTRARKSLQDLKTLAQEIRIQIQESKKA